ncbi:MAG: bifunctional folylpolyglutamate synthase/dihydrofolate synthase [Tannerella sp.]|jgi:dihydrofolate synthase/folylpolyglutamate synthase|nr:bifunctional folylpolyglutamate synthase/dihydrofolate synthase [Tannerella sp.]
MTYIETLSYLYSCAPAFHQVGSSAYKPGLERSEALDYLVGHPHRNYLTVHVAGTNGKGSVSHMLAAALREAKYRVGLYTSPHLVDFCERVRVNGKNIPKQYVVDFVDRHRIAIESLKPSFFEVTTNMAFEFFRHKKVDIAIVETGLGGRLDSTNIISPILCVITNVSMEHKQYLGNTLAQIASEKAGIIKAHTPVVIGEAPDSEILEVFRHKALSINAPLFLATEEQRLLHCKQLEDDRWEIHSPEFGYFLCDLKGAYQRKNVQTALTALHRLKSLRVKVPSKAVCDGLGRVTELTGMEGRWHTLQTHPFILCDTGHNPGAWELLTPQLQQKAASFMNLRMVVGIMGDKDVDAVLSLMPSDAVYYFTQATVNRALPARLLAEKGQACGLHGKCYDSVEEAVKAAMREAISDDMIFIGGSNFIVAEALPMFAAERASKKPVPE